MEKETIFCSAIIVAAGSGKRMGADKPKQFLELCGKTIIERTAAVFSGCSCINEMIIVSSEEGISESKKLLGGLKKKIKYVIGGSERYESVYNGIKAVDKNCQVVIIHDGVRPFVTEGMIENSVEEAVRFGACVCAVNSKDTVKICTEDGFVDYTPKRSLVYNIQTPQTFKRDIIETAYRTAFETGSFGTDDASLVENCGIPVKIIKGSYYNIKITTPDDLVVGEKILNGGDGYKDS